MEDAVESGSKERVLTPASQRVSGLLIVAGVTAIKQSLSLPIGHSALGFSIIMPIIMPIFGDVPSNRYYHLLRGA